MNTGNPATQADWRQFPYQLVPGDPQLDFPAAEGMHRDFQSDTWYLAGYLTGGESGRRFAFIAIFNRNRPGGELVADFHTVALFDIDQGTYGTFTDYDMPPKNLQPGAISKLDSAEGHLDLTYRSSAGVSAWTTRRDIDGEIVPFHYDFAVFGNDAQGAAMELRLQLTPSRPPVPVGASRYNGKIVACLQDDTYSYFQTGVQMSGTLRWGDFSDDVTGDAGHIDRQWFPSYAGGGGTAGDMRAVAHQWHTIALNNGVDLSVWRQFDRRAGNALVPFTGITTCSGDDAPPQCVEDLVVTVTSYVRWPDDVRSLVRPVSRARYVPERHIVKSAALDLELVGEPLVHAPGHALPIEYLEGPYRYRGTMGDREVTGLALYESTDVMYRDWELVDVLETQIACAAAGSVGLTSAITELRSLIQRKDSSTALNVIARRLRPQLAELPDTVGDELLAILDDIADAVHNDVR